MKVTKETNDKGKEEIRIALAPDDAGLGQSVLLHFAEQGMANCKKHHARRRRLAILIDKVL